MAQICLLSERQKFKKALANWEANCAGWQTFSGVRGCAACCRAARRRRLRRAVGRQFVAVAIGGPQPAADAALACRFAPGLRPGQFQPAG